MKIVFNADDVKALVESHCDEVMGIGVSPDEIIIDTAMDTLIVIVEKEIAPK